MIDFEDFLKQQPLRRIPAQWRGEILAAAKPPRAKEKPTQSPWWLAWLWPSPVAWAGVACAWLFIIGLNAGSRPSAVETRTVALISPQGIGAALVRQQGLVQELFRSLEEPAEPPRGRRAPGACNESSAQTKLTIV